MGKNINTALYKYPQINLGFANIWALNFSQFQDLFRFLNTETEIDFGFLLNSYNAADYILSLRTYPFYVRQFFADGVEQQPQNIHVGIYETNVQGSYMSANEFNSINIFSTYIAPVQTEDYLRFLDYEGFTEISIYIPCFNWIDLPVNEVMGKYLFVNISVDFNTGEGMIIILVSDDNNINNSRILLTQTSQVGYDMPIGSANLRETTANYYRQMVGLAATGVVAISSLKGASSTTTKSVERSGSTTLLRKTQGGTNRKYTLPTSSEETTTQTTKHSGGALAAIPLTSAINNALGGNSQSVQVQRGNSNNVWNNKALTGSILLMYKRCVPLIENTDSETYAHVYGFPTFQIVNSITNLYNNNVPVDNAIYRFSDVTIENIPQATSDEITMIEEALKGGFHL